MPEMNSLIIDDVMYDLRDPTKAPSGFGYGEALAANTAETEAELESKLIAIINEMSNYTTKQVRFTLQFLGVNTNYLTTVFKHTSTYALVTFQTMRLLGATLSKVYTNGSWNPIQWENPPFENGVEYRTTEHLGSKAVYKRNLDGMIQYRLDGETGWKNLNALMGAAPAGYGVGSSSKSIGDANDATVGGVYYYGSTASNIPDGFGNGVIFVQNRADAQIFQTITDIYGLSAERIRQSNGTWGAWKRCDPSAFAPSGYGLGTNGQLTNDWNTTTLSGFYYGKTNSPDGGWWAGVVYAEGAGYAFQHLYKNASTAQKVRECNNGTWGAWVDVSPTAFAPATHTHTATDVGAVPTSRTVNGKALSRNISLSASDVGARASTWMPTASEVGARPSSWTPSAADVGAVPTMQVRGNSSTSAGWYRIGTLHPDANLNVNGALRLILANTYVRAKDSTVIVDIATGRKAAAATVIAKSETPQFFKQLRLAWVDSNNPAAYYVEAYHDATSGGEQYAGVAVIPLFGTFTAGNIINPVGDTANVVCTVSLT